MVIKKKKGKRCNPLEEKGVQHLMPCLACVHECERDE